MSNLHIDIETYSSIDIRKSGAYKYCESLDFEIMLVAYSFDSKPIKIVDLTRGEILPEKFIKALTDKSIKKHAHNATFERICFRAYGLDSPISQWVCSQIKSAYCGFPLSLANVSKAMELGDSGKLSTGKALIQYFCTPCKPKKTNEGRKRNLPKHDLEKWEEFKIYCIQDVKAEITMSKNLSCFDFPIFEQDNYLLDQIINDRGLLVDLPFAKQAYAIDLRNVESKRNRIKEITEVDNPNSLAQLKTWIGEAMKKEIKSLAKDTIPILIEEAESSAVKEVLQLRLGASRSSVKKYVSMKNCASDEDNRVRGLFQFYGASKTGRWAGRLVQLQNLPRNYLKNLSGVRKIVNSGDYDTLGLLYDNISDVISQLIRTAFIAPPRKIFAVADFSAIEARVIAWVAGETWRLKVFNSHGKIYEASASMMFGVPIEEITKGSELRTRGKIAELALGYGGSLGALKKMGGESMGLSTLEMKNIVEKWRGNNRKITKLWKDVEKCAKIAIKQQKSVKLRMLVFDYKNEALTILLPSGRKLFYQKPSFTLNKWDRPSIQYKGMIQGIGKFGNIETYGGKLVENIIQAIARDCLAYSMQSLDKNGYRIVMHVHDEAICEIPMKNRENSLSDMCEIMGETIPWAPDLPLVADGYLTEFYKKD